MTATGPVDDMQIDLRSTQRFSRQPDTRGRWAGEGIFNTGSSGLQDEWPPPLLPLRPVVFRPIERLHGAVRVSSSLRWNTAHSSHYLCTLRRDAQQFTLYYQRLQSKTASKRRCVFMGQLAVPPSLRVQHRNRRSGSQHFLPGIHEDVQLRTPGDTMEFDDLVDRYEKPIYNLILRLVGDPDEAADLTQDAFVSAYRSYSSFRAVVCLHVAIRIALTSAEQDQGIRQT